VLDARQRHEFFDRGFTFLPGALAPAEIDSMRAALERARAAGRANRTPLAREVGATPGSLGERRA